MRARTWIIGTALGVSALSGSPAFAINENPFKVYIDAIYGSTELKPPGVKAEFTFTVTKTGNNVNLALKLDNTSPNPPIKASTLVGAAFKVPTGLTLSSYNSNSTNFTKLFTGNNADIPGLGDYEFCIRSSGSGPQNNCAGGQANDGLSAADPAATVFFNYTDSKSRTQDELVGQFIDLFSTTGNVAGRFQQITCTNPGPCAGSDKVGGLYKPPFAPPNTVPGPLPIFGAAAAFGFSRKLRHRLKASRKAS